MSYKQPLSKNQAGVKLTRSDKGKPRLTRRDRDVLRQIGEGTAYCFDQLQGLLARHPDTQSKDPSCSSESRTRALIRRWEQLGLVEYRKILHDEPGWIWLTRKGLYHVGLSARFHEPSLANLEHLFWINETRALIEDTYGSAPGFTWESERQIRATREHLRAQRKKQGKDLWIPDEYRGRIMALYSMTVVGLGPFGSLGAGALAGHFGARYTMATGGVLALTASLVFALPTSRFERPGSHGTSKN